MDEGEKKIEKLFKEFDKIDADPNMKKKADESHKKLTEITLKDLKKVYGKNKAPPQTPPNTGEGNGYSK